MIIGTRDKGQGTGDVYLSVIIVNYNVKYFLEQCLHAVQKATQKLSSEVFVVDNHSADGSLQMVTEKFPWVNLIANQDNKGFAKANNQAIKQAKGQYILLLNPDTLVQEDSFVKCIGYMDNHADVGCLGVKMIDGKGRYLPESKRALPTPLVAFYKIFGLAALFPHSKRFGKYHLGYLDRNTIHEVDIISGAYMFIRKTALDEVGILDEGFFMYGEDIDLSYRFKISGYRNIYFPITTIIHYKGESTKKSSINYVILFYRAMIFFAQKHFSKNKARYFSLFINFAIYIRAGISILIRFLAGIITPLLDACIIFIGYYLFLPVWENYHFGQSGGYPSLYPGFVVPAYILVWLLAIFIATGYRKKIILFDLVKGIVGGTVFILLVYSLLPESLRFSRALILIGTCWALFSTISLRYLLYKLFRNRFQIGLYSAKRRIIIIGEIQESNRVLSIIIHSHIAPELVGLVNPLEDQVNLKYLGHIGQIEDIVRINQVDELVFCAANLSAQQIIRTMLLFTNTDITFKIAPPESISVIGSNSRESEGDLYVLNFKTLSKPINRFRKRFFDITAALTLLTITPIWLLIVKRPAGLLRNIFCVAVGLYSWVGYYKSRGGHHPGLPPVKPGVLTPHDLQKLTGNETGSNNEDDLLYAKDYRVLNDLRIIMNGFRDLGRKPPVLTKS